jgi:glycosyltransferase involved in cell wall biosynthesis
LIPVSGCVISLNEADRIERCLRSLSFCTEVVVLDSGSTDGTRELAAKLGARVETQAFLGHRRQKQRCVDLARHDWILSLDCDEEVTSELRAEIERTLVAEPPADVAGYRSPRRNIYLGRLMRHGLFWPDVKLRLFHRQRAAWGGVDPHDRVEPVGPGRCLELAGAIVHDSYRSFAEHRATVQRFAGIAARALADEGRRPGPLAPLVHAAASLGRGLVLKAGILDGWRGLLAGCMSARYDWIKYRELRRLVTARP